MAVVPRQCTRSIIDSVKRASVEKNLSGCNGISSGASSLEKKPLGRSLTQPQGTEQYTVEASDTLAGIAARFDTTPSELAKLNRLSARMVFPGQAVNPSEIWPALSSCANWLSIEDFFSDAVFIHSDNVICPFNVLYIDEARDVRFFIC
ncbi:nuclear receptor coactivator 7 [Trichonephila clavipes]|nr:nuclear receptor coactivator 7 [Trichonephila clavipes]